MRGCEGEYVHRYSICEVAEGYCHELLSSSDSLICELSAEADLPPFLPPSDQESLPSSLSTFSPDLLSQSSSSSPTPSVNLPLTGRSLRRERSGQSFLFSFALPLFTSSTAKLINAPPPFLSSSLFIAGLGAAFFTIPFTVLINRFVNLPPSSAFLSRLCVAFLYTSLTLFALPITSDPS